jgi:hypothetical protein
MLHAVEIFLLKAPIFFCHWSLAPLFFNDRYWPKADINQAIKERARLELSKQSFKMSADDPKRTSSKLNFLKT